MGATVLLLKGCVELGNIVVPLGLVKRGSDGRAEAVLRGKLAEVPVIAAGSTVRTMREQTPRECYGATTYTRLVFVGRLAVILPCGCL